MIQLQVCKTDYHYGIIEIYKSKFDGMKARNNYGDIYF